MFLVTVRFWIHSTSPSKNASNVFFWVGVFTRAEWDEPSRGIQQDNSLRRSMVRLIFCPLSPAFSMLGHHLLMFFSPLCMHEVTLLPPVFPAFPPKNTSRAFIPFPWLTTLSRLLGALGAKTKKSLPHHLWHLMMRYFSKSLGSKPPG